jgi:Mg-chelatase subunit ChlI
MQGEDGIGKSRLLAALREPLAADTAITLRLRCSPYHSKAHSIRSSSSSSAP